MEPLEQALVIRAVREQAGGAFSGGMLNALRGDVAGGAYHGCEDAAAAAAPVERHARALTQTDMPPPTDLVATLIEALAVRLGREGSQSRAWRSIGIKPGSGRGYLARQAHAVDWPVWRALRDAALDGIDLGPTDAAPATSVAGEPTKTGKRSRAPGRGEPRA